MTIKTSHLSVKKYANISGVSAPSVYITFPAFFKKVTHIRPKMLIGYTFKNNVLRLTIEDSKKENTVLINKNNSISLSEGKCPAINLLNIPAHASKVEFAVEGSELVLDMSQFKQKLVGFEALKNLQVKNKPSFSYYANQAKKKANSK